MGTLYPGLMRLEQRGAIRGSWGVTDNNRKARFYDLTAAGRKLLDAEKREWNRTVAIMQALLRRAAVMAALRAWLRRLWGTFRKAPARRRHGRGAAAARRDARRRTAAARPAARTRRMRQAQLQAGGVAQAMEQRRDQRGLPWLEDLLQDLRFGARTAAPRRPGSPRSRSLTLTLAIGANTAIFSLVDPLLFRDLPVRDPGRLVQFTFQYPLDPPLNMFSLASYEHYRDGNHVFSDVFGLTPLSTESRAG